MYTLKGRLIRAMQDRSTEWLSSAMMLSWGVTLAWPGDTLAGPTFAAFRKLGMTEATWAATFIFAATARMAALWINGRWPKTPWIRAAFSTFGAASWLQIALLLSLGRPEDAPLNTGPGVYAVLALFDFISVFRASVDVRYHQPR